MVVNTDSAGFSGSHWCALFVRSPSRVDFYDSFAEWPTLSKGIADFLSRFQVVEKCDRALQSDESSACGKHCIYFLVNRCNGVSFERILQKLLICKQKSDNVVSAFVRRLLVPSTI
jgi:hypothetical protein